MKILAVSDLVLERLYTPQLGEQLRGVNLILGCGDLPYGYLEFLVTTLNVPLLFVPGNHDPRTDIHNPASHAEGCENIDLRVVSVKGLTIAGLGGCNLYHAGRANQYTQAGMMVRVLRLLPALLWHRIRNRRPVDIFIAHSPAFGIQDDDDLPHQGFKAFLLLMRLARPRYFLHGHKMVYKSNLEPTISNWESTQIMNVYPSRMIEVQPHV